MKRIIYVILAVFFFILGVIGLLFPVIPQVPFFAVSVLFLCAASEKFRKKFTGSRLYQKHLKKYMDKNKKWRALIEKIMG